VQHKQWECGEEYKDLWNRIQQNKSTIQQRVWGGKGMEKHCACFGCGLLQAICVQWAAVEGDEGSFVKVRGRECQYRGLAVNVVAAIITMRRKEAKEAIWAEMEKKGIANEGVEIVDMLAKRVQWGGLTTNWLTRVFYICSTVA
jgi:hypothetical protein